jgi:hypothetical protein
MKADIAQRFDEWLSLPPRIDKGRATGYSIIRHPLCVELYSPQLGLTHAHELINQNRRLIRAHIVKDDWGAVLTLVTRAYRPEALFMMWEAIAPSLRQATFAWCWTDTEEPDQPAWHRLWNRVEKPVFDGYAARMWYDALGKDERVTVYRGGKSANRSWALSRDVAVFFATRYKELFGTQQIRSKEITKAEILGVFFDRKEREIVLEISS